jgi:hypothetical protein
MKFDNMIFSSIIKGLLLSILYFEITHANDTTPRNIFLFTSFFVILFNGAHLLGIDSNVVITAFITKIIFTVVDDRIKKKDNENEKNKYTQELIKELIKEFKNI